MRFSRHERLQQMCLNVVIRNLKKYIFNENIPQINIDFLLRIHSDEVFKRYKNDNIISEDIMLWFLNQHSRVIYLSFASENIIRQLQRMGSTISYLNLKESLATENMLNSILCCTPCLIKLNLSFTSCLDKTLLGIKKLCPQITCLNLSYCSITDQGMMNLCGLPLKTLNLKGTSVTPTGLSIILEGMPHLEHLKYHHFAEIFYQIHKENFGGGNGIVYNLTELIYENLGNSRVSDVLQIWIALCPNLMKVSISFAVTLEELELCSQFKSLQSLKVYCLPGMMTFTRSVVFEDKSGMGLSNILVPFMLRDKMTTLILNHTEIPTRELIEGFKNLKVLALQNVTFTEFSEEYIKPNKNNLEKLILKEISFRVLNNYKALLKLLTVCRNVSELQLCSTKTIPADVFEAILSSMEYLTNADFSFTPITRATAVKCFQLPSMKTLSVDGCWNISSIEDFRGMVFRERMNTLSWHLQVDDYISEDSDENRHYGSTQ